MKISTCKLGFLMAEREMNFKELSEETGISRTTLSAVNNGKACKPEVVCRIARAFDIEPDVLLVEVSQ